MIRMTIRSMVLLVVLVGCAPEEQIDTNVEFGTPKPCQAYASLSKDNKPYGDRRR